MLLESGALVHEPDFLAINQTGYPRDRTYAVNRTSMMNVCGNVKKRQKCARSKANVAVK